jgi:hypothetical protein
MGPTVARRISAWAVVVRNREKRRARRGRMMCFLQTYGDAAEKHDAAEKSIVGLYVL